MTAIDQAFIKAFMRQSAAPAATAPGSAGGVRRADPPPEEADVEVPRRPTEVPADESPSAEADVDGGTDCSVDDRRTSDAELPQTERQEEQPIEPTAAPTSEPDLPVDPDAVTSTRRAPFRSEDVQTTCDGRGFEPSFEVDGFVWPSGCTRLSTASGDQIDQLADALTEGLERGQQVLAISGCHRGDGCTTLLLCVARRLSQRRLKVVLVDADFDNPLLARRLGLRPEAGWEQLLAGRLPAAEVTIESIEDRLAVLPWCGPLAGPHEAAEDPPNLAADLGVLREHYDLVLVDLGTFPGEKAGEHRALDAVRRWIDAVVVVYNVRSTSEAELDRTRQQIEAAGLVEAGIVENFADVCAAV